MGKKVQRAEISRIMVEHNRDMFAPDARTAIRLGIEYVTLKGKADICGINFDEEIVDIPDEDIPELRKAVKIEFKCVDIHELTEKEVEQLCKQIEFGSCYVDSYENAFGVPAEQVCEYADGWLETKENPEEYGDYETFYDYIQSVE